MNSLEGGQKMQLCGCEGTVAGMGSHSIAFLCDGISFILSVYMQQSCLSRFFLHCLVLTAGGVARVGERVAFSSPDENARAGETAPKFQYQPTLATPLVSACTFYNSLIDSMVFQNSFSYSSAISFVISRYI